MGIENFNSYTETDPNNVLTVTSNRVTFTAVTNLDVGNVKKAHSGLGDFTHHIENYLSAVDDGGVICVWGMSDNQDTFSAMNLANQGITVYRQRSAATYRLRVYDFTNNNSDTYNGAVDTLYYLTIKRLATTLTVKIYSDSARTNLLDTLSIVSTDAVYTQIFGYLSFDNASFGASTSTGYNQNLDLNELAYHRHIGMTFFDKILGLPTIIKRYGE